MSEPSVKPELTKRLPLRIQPKSMEHSRRALRRKAAEEAQQKNQQIQKSDNKKS